MPFDRVVDYEATMSNWSHVTRAIDTEKKGTINTRVPTIKGVSRLGLCITTVIYDRRKKHVYQLIQPVEERVEYIKKEIYI